MKEYIKQLPIVGKVASKGYRTGYTFITRRKHELSERFCLQKLSKLTHSKANLIYHALQALSEPLPPQEQMLLDRIEDERKRLLSMTGLLVNAVDSPDETWDVDVTIKQATEASKRPKAAMLMYSLIRTIKPLNVIELGTNVGISSAYIATALHVNNQNGRVTTFEGSPHRLALAKEVHQALNINNINYVQGYFSDTLDHALKECGSVDFAFIDGHHQYAPTMDYFNKILSCSQDDTVFVFDDIRWSEGMIKAWSELLEDKRNNLAVDLNSMGLCVASQGATGKPYRIGPMYRPLQDR